MASSADSTATVALQGTSFDKNLPWAVEAARALPSWLARFLGKSSFRRNMEVVPPAVGLFGLSAFVCAVAWPCCRIIGMFCCKNEDGHLAKAHMELLGFMFLTVRRMQFGLALAQFNGRIEKTEL